MKRRPSNNIRSRKTTERFDALTRADRIYFIGKASWEFWQLGPHLASALPRFDGVVVTHKSEAESKRFCSHFERSLASIEPPELLRLAENHKITLVDFSTNFVSLYWVDKLAEHKNITRCDYIQGMYEADRTYPYTTLRFERDFILKNLKRYKDLMAVLNDEHSRDVLQARLNALINLDRRYLFQTQSPQHLQYFCANCPKLSLTPGPNEIYVDVGAHTGVTIRSFLEASRGQYKKIIAVEPYQPNYAIVKNIGKVLPRYTAYHAALGDFTGFTDFHYNDVLTHGSNALEEPNATVRMVQLDEIAPDATLIKMDVEGFETKVLGGAKKTIRTNHPSMAIATYHYANDLFDIMECVQGIHKYKNIALRQYALTLFDFIYLFSDTQTFA